MATTNATTEFTVRARVSVQSGIQQVISPIFPSVSSSMVVLTSQHYLPHLELGLGAICSHKNFKKTSFSSADYLRTKKIFDVWIEFCSHDPFLSEQSDNIMAFRFALFLSCCYGIDQNIVLASLGFGSITPMPFVFPLEVEMFMRDTLYAAILCTHISFPIVLEAPLSEFWMVNHIPRNLSTSLLRIDSGDVLFATSDIMTSIRICLHVLINSRPQLVRDLMTPVTVLSHEFVTQAGFKESVTNLLRFASDPGTSVQEAVDSIPILRVGNSIATSFISMGEKFSALWKWIVEHVKLWIAPLAAAFAHVTAALSETARNLVKMFMKLISPENTLVEEFFDAPEPPEEFFDAPTPGLYRTQGPWEAAPFAFSKLFSYYSACGFSFRPSPKTFAVYKSTALGVDSMVSDAIKFVIMVLRDITPSWVVNLAGGDTSAELSVWIDEVLDLFQRSATNSLVLDSTLLKRIRDKISVGNAFLLASKTKGFDSLNPVITDLIRKLEVMERELAPRLTTLSLTRARPVLTMLHGQSGKGKSNLLLYLAKIMAARNSSVDPERIAAYMANPRNEIYMHGTDKFYDTATSYQSVFIADDYDQRAPKSGDETSLGGEVVHINNDASYPLRMANLSDKNNVFARFSHTFYSTNSKSFHDPTMREVRALANRVDFLIEVDRVDSNGVKAQNVRSMDTSKFDCSLYRLHVCKADNQMAFRRTGETWSVAKLVSKIIEQQDRNEAYFLSTNLDPFSELQSLELAIEKEVKNEKWNLEKQRKRVEVSQMVHRGTMKLENATRFFESIWKEEFVLLPETQAGKCVDLAGFCRFLKNSTPLEAWSIFADETCCTLEEFFQRHPEARDMDCDDLYSFLALCPREDFLPPVLGLSKFEWFTDKTHSLKVNLLKFKNKLKELYNKALEKAIECFKTIRTFMYEHSWIAIAAAVVVGAITVYFSRDMLSSLFSSKHVLSTEQNAETGVVEIVPCKSPKGPVHFNYENESGQITAQSEFMDILGHLFEKPYMKHPEKCTFAKVFDKSGTMVCPICQQTSCLHPWNQYNYLESLPVISAQSNPGNRLYSKANVRSNTRARQILRDYKIAGGNYTTQSVCSVPHFRQSQKDTNHTFSRCFTQGVVNDIVGVVQKNLMEVVFKFGGETATMGFAVGLEKRRVLMPLHFITETLMALDDSHLPWEHAVEICLTTSSGVTSFFLDEILVMGYSPDAEIDAFFFEVPRMSFQEMPSIVKHFVTSDAAASLIFTVSRNVQARLVRPRDDMLITNLHGAIEIPVISSNESEIRKNVITYYADCYSGLCGSPLVSVGSRYQGKIMGLHIAGDVHSRASFAALVTQDMIAEAFHEVKPETSTFIFPIINTQAGKDYHGSLPLDYVTRNLDPGCDTHVKNNLIPWQPTEYEHMPRKTLATVPKPQNFELNRSAFGEVPSKGVRYPDVLLDHMRRWYLSNSGFLAGSDRVYPIKEAIMGIPDTHFGAIDPKTSTGFPDTAFGVSGPDYWSISVAGEFIPGPKFSVLIADINDFIQLAKLDVTPAVLFKDCMKGERIKAQKVIDGKVRFINVLPKYLVVLYKMYYGFAIHVLAEGAPMNTILKGYDEKDSTYWTFVGKYLDVFGDNVGAGDYSGFDHHQSSSSVSFAFDLFDSFYPSASDTDKKVRKSLRSIVLNQYHAYGSVVEKYTDGMPSGLPLTSEINCVTNLRLFLTAFLNIVDGDVTMLKEFPDIVHCFFLGDDNIFAVRQDYASKFTPQLIAETVAYEGHVYTDVNKGPAQAKLGSLSEASVLKRGFRKLSDGSYDAPLDLDTVLEMPMWTRDSADRVVIAGQNIDTALRELSLHGENVFNEWLPKLRKFSGVFWQPFCEDWRTIHNLTRKSRHFK